MSRQTAWKGVVGDWTHIQGFSGVGKLACLTDQQRQTLLTFIQAAFWRTRWTDAPSEDILNAFMSKLEESLMTDCDYMFSIRQRDCYIELLLNGVVVSSFKLDAEECGLLGAGGEGTKVVAPGVIEDDKKTALFSGAMALIIYCQEAVIDAFNAIEAEIEIGKAATVWMETVPGLDLSPAYEVLQACDDFNEMLESVFEATDTPEWREEMSCKIMCWCVINNYTFDTTVIDTFRDYLTDQGLSAPDYFYSNFVDVATYKALLDRFSLGMNDEDEDWMVICDDCYSLFGLVTFDDVETDLDYTVTVGTVTDVGNPDDGLEGESWFEAPWTTGRRSLIRVDLGENVDVKMVSFQFNYDNFPGGEINREIRLLNSAEVEVDNWQLTDGPAQTEWITEEHPFEEADVRYVEIEMKFNSNYTGSMWIWSDNIKIYQPEP